ACGFQAGEAGVSSKSSKKLSLQGIRSEGAAVTVADLVTPRATCPVETGPAIYPMDTMRTRIQATGKGHVGPAPPVKEEKKGWGHSYGEALGPAERGGHIHGHLVLSGGVSDEGRDVCLRVCPRGQRMRIAEQLVRAKMAFDSGHRISWEIHKKKSWLLRHKWPRAVSPRVRAAHMLQMRRHT
ncbi:hypothetical protein E2I00_008553, partial [Balaenoptera physalus]